MDFAHDPDIRKRQLRVDQYRGLAREAALAAAGESLERVRDQREAAAVIWTALADAEEARMADRRSRLAKAGVQ